MQDVTIVVCVCVCFLTQLKRYCVCVFSCTTGKIVCSFLFPQPISASFLFSMFDIAKYAL